MVFELPSQYGDGAAAVGQGLRHGLATRGEPVRNWQTIAKRTQYSEHDRADQLLDVPSLMDGMSDHEHGSSGFVKQTLKPELDVDNHPPTTEEPEVREYPLDLAAVRKQLSDKREKQYWRTLEELSQDSPFADFMLSEFLPTGSD